MCELSAISVADVMRAPGLSALIAEYEAESRGSEMPAAQPQWGHYEALERAGVLFGFGVRKEGEVIGFLALLHTTIPHYAGPVCVVESVFVAKSHRRTGAGSMLIRAAEAFAREHQATLLFSAPAGGVLEAVLPRMGYRHSNTVFAKGAPCATSSL